MRVIAIANQKGGCGKTTTSINLSACLALLQKTVLLIDLDPQGHSTCGLGVKIEKGAFTLYDLLSLTQRLMPAFPNVIRSLEPSFDLLPSHAGLYALEEEFSFVPNYHLKLKNLIDRITQEHRQYDFVVLDCPPNLGILTWNALHAAHEVIIPVEPSFFSLHGLGKISETIQTINEGRDVPLGVHALLTLFDSELDFCKEIHDEVKKHFQGRLFGPIIHRNVHLKEAAAAGQSIVQYGPHSSAFRDYLNLAVEYLERDWDRKLPESELGWDRVWENHFGPRRVPGGILFQFFNKTAKLVEIAGDFNHWVPERLTIREDQKQLWQKVITVQEKAFRYKFIVDGEWQVDPYQPVQKQNAHGGVDSFLELT